MINNKLYKEDFINIIKNIPDNSIDLILTDPPYNISNTSKVYYNKNGITNFNYTWDHIDINLFSIFISKIKDSGNIVIFYDSKYVNKIIELYEKNNAIFKNFIYYIKNGRGINPRKNFVNIIETALWFVKSSKYIWNGGGCSLNGIKDETNELNNPKKCFHPTQKPIILFEKIIKLFSNENNIILDPFAGSGTTAIASIRTNRKFICIEKEEKYYNIAHKRIDDEYNRYHESDKILNLI